MTAVGDLLEGLAACLCATLTPTGADGPGLCFCGVLSGEGVSMDIGFDGDDACGMAWVRLLAAYPATQMGQLDQNGTPCGVYLGLDIEVGVLRGYEIPDAKDIPTPQELEAQAIQQADDMVLARKAISCCPALENLDYMLSIYQPIGPEGGLAGGAWMVSVLL